MKSVKYTLAALAIIALASVGAKAQSTGTPGDMMLGVFNTTDSLEFDLGSALTNGETWNLGNVTSLAGTNLSFSIIAGSEKNFAEGSFPKNTLAVAGVNIASVAVLPLSTVITLQTTSFSQGTAETAGSASIKAEELDVNSSASDSYANLDGASATGGGSSFGLGYDIDQVFTGTDSAALYTLTGTGAPVAIGTFTTSTVGGITTLTFDTVAAPEPSAYALGLCAVALFFVLKRRRSVA